MAEHSSTEKVIKLMEAAFSARCDLPLPLSTRILVEDWQAEYAKQQAIMRDLEVQMKEWLNEHS